MNVLHFWTCADLRRTRKSLWGLLGPPGGPLKALHVVALTFHSRWTAPWDLSLVTFVVQIAKIAYLTALFEGPSRFLHNL